ncbi:MAG: FG-GAP-like repeat-containing protein, partial [Gemmatimonadota bacterium]
MRVRTLSLLALLALALLQEAAPALAAHQVVALFTPEVLDGTAPGAEGGPPTLDNGALATRLEQSLKEKLQDRFDIRLAGPGGGRADGAEAKRKARALGATYTLHGTVTRIGRSVSLDLTLAPVEAPGKGTTVVVSGTDAGTPVPAQDVPFVYRRLVIEGSAKLKLAFFGDEAVGGGAARRKIPALSGTVGRSRSIPGDVISVAMIDTDRDGRDEVVAGYTDSIGIYRVEGDDLVEKARIPYPGGGIVRVDGADINRNGIAEIIAVRYLSGKAVSDLWEYDGKEYRRVGTGLPLFLRSVDLGPEGVVLAGQESDPSTIFRGPVFRVKTGRSGDGREWEKGAPLPLPAGTWIDSFTPLKFGGTMRFAVLGERGWLSLLDGNGARLGEATERVSGTDLVLETALGAAAPRALAVPNRLFAVDLDGDGTDEIVVLNNLVIPGGFFENIRVYSN